MLNDSGYYREADSGIADIQNDIVVNSAGHYRLLRQERFETVRTFGRLDIQLLYIASGSAEFMLDGKLCRLAAGSMALYLPGDTQFYRYTLQDAPDVYWVHFTGVQAIKMLAEGGFDKTARYDVGVRSEYLLLIQKIIRELQLQKPRFLALAACYLQELIHHMARQIQEQSPTGASGHALIERAIADFHQSYNAPIRIADYAQSLNISCCWFIRSFRQRTGFTPQRYITQIRINRAKELLGNHRFTCSEVAQMVGYANALYFSRVFKQVAGVSPQAYKNQAQNDRSSL